MLHFAICCNLLAAIGGSPQLNTPAAVPSYPGPLPGGVHPGLVVGLAGLSREVAKSFMEVEFPEEGPLARGVEQFATIGEFYGAIDAALVALAPSMSVGGQLEHDLMPDLRVMSSVDEAREALTLIKRQGEGSKASPEEAEGDLAHYYRFGEIYHERKLRKNPVTGTWAFDGDPVPFPDVWRVAPVPAGGYARSQVPPDVWTLLEQFDRTFTSMLNELQTAWATSATDSLEAAVNRMFALRRPAVDLMKVQIAATATNYGPCFRLLT
jgi:hypothetical protein